MPPLLQGRFTSMRQMATWIAVGFGVSYVFAVLAILLRPDDMEFHFLRTCVSKVGSFDAEYNPTGFLWFSASQVVISICMIPLVLYRHRRMSAAVGASHRMRILTTLFLIGVVGYGFTGIVPMGRPILVAGLTWDNIHDVSAKIAFICFGSGILIEGTVILLKHRAAKRGTGTAVLPFRRLIKPYALATTVGTLAVFFLLSWDIKRAEDPTLRWTGEGLYAFALWEWIMFVTAPITVAWIAVAWMRTPPTTDA